jgi:hypothetical protein
MNTSFQLFKSSPKTTAAAAAMTTTTEEAAYIIETTKLAEYMEGSEDPLSEITPAQCKSFAAACGTQVQKEHGKKRGK